MFFIIHFIADLENVRQRTHEIDGHKLEISDKPFRTRPVPKKRTIVQTSNSKEVIITKFNCSF